MAAVLSIQLKGFEELAGRMRGFPAKVERSVFRKSLRSTGTKISRRLKSGTPRVMGDAKRSVKVKVRVRRGGAYARIGYTKKPSMYMRIREHGSVRQPARPFFRQAVGSWEREASSEFLTALQREIAKVAG